MEGDDDLESKLRHEWPTIIDGRRYIAEVRGLKDLSADAILVYLIKCHTRGFNFDEDDADTVVTVPDLLCNPFSVTAFFSNGDPAQLLELRLGISPKVARQVAKKLKARGYAACP